MLHNGLEHQRHRTDRAKARNTACGFPTVNVIAAGGDFVCCVLSCSEECEITCPDCNGSSKSGRVCFFKTRARSLCKLSGVKMSRSKNPKRVNCPECLAALADAMADAAESVAVDWRPSHAIAEDHFAL